ncbi:MAG: hypothetical protein ACE5K3_10385 [bacterium]
MSLKCIFLSGYSIIFEALRQVILGHLKAYQDVCPVIIIGGTARDFLGEYMAEGLIVILGPNQKA